jgi:hypothetical protein
MAALKQELTVSGHVVVLEFDDEVVSQGDRITGALTVIPQGERETGALEIRMQEYFRQVEDDEDTLTTRTRTRTHEKVVLTEFESRTVVRKHDFSVQLEQAQRYPFSLKLPKNCRPSTESGGWQLSVTMQNERGLYPDTDMVRFPVELGEEMQAILQTLVGRMKFVEDRERRNWDSWTKVTHLWLNPPTVLEAELDGLALELRQADKGSVEGTLVFDLQEKSLADYFRALSSQDLVRCDVSLGKSELFLENGQRNDEALSKALGGILSGVLAKR